MKFLRFDGNRTGLLVEREDRGQGALDISASLPDFARHQPELAALLGPHFSATATSWKPIIAGWSHLRDAFQALIEFEGAVHRPLSTVRLEPPLPDPASRIFAAGANFQDHIEGALGAVAAAKEVVRSMAEGMPPWGFFVIPGTVVGPDAVIAPPTSIEKLDYEAEIAVVLQNGGSRMSSGEIKLWGYTAWNDFSIRDQFFGLAKVDPGPGLNWALQKNFEGGNACGPWMIVDEPSVGKDLELSLTVNGEKRQSSSTREMIHGFGAVAERISQYLALVAGDMLLSGTPAGTAVEFGLDGPYLKDGDVVEVEVEGIGEVLRNVVRM